MENYYKILGLKLGVTLDEVEEKYKQLLKEFDPEKQSEDLKEFFSVEYEKVKEAYNEISLSLINTESVEQVVDEINSEKNALQSTTEKKKSVKKKSKKVAKKVVDKSPVRKRINKSQKDKGNKSSISSEIELKLTRAYLIMFILGFPVFYFLGNFSNFEVRDMVGFYHYFFPILFHLLAMLLVLLFHMVLIIISSGFLSIRENLAAYFIERKKYFIRILAFTPLVLVSLYGWGGMIKYSEGKDFWYNSYQEIKSEVSGDDYDSNCNERKALKIHNQSTQDLRIYISYKKKDGNWSGWYNWGFSVGDYSGIRLMEERVDYEKHNGGTIYTTDYRYYIRTLDNEEYLYSYNVPHVTNTCNAKCINIY